MNATFIIHRVIAVGFNLFFIAWILYIVLTANNDKSPGVFFFFYIALMFLNLVLAFVLAFLKTKHFKIYRQIFLGEILLFVPLTIVVIYM